MTKLLKSELSRLFKNKVFYLLVIALTVLSLTGDGQLSYSHPLYNLSFSVIGASLFTLLFVGRIFRERTVNNLLASGVTKTQLYFCEFLMSVIISLSCTVPMLLFFVTKKYDFLSNMGIDIDISHDQYNISFREFLELLSNHEFSFTAMLLTLFALAFFVTALACAASVAVAVTLHSDIKALPVYVAALLLMTWSANLYTPEYDALPYYLDEAAVEFLQSGNPDIDIFDSSSLEKIPELKNYRRNNAYIGGTKRAIFRITSNAFIGVHIERLINVTADLLYGDIAISGNTGTAYYSDDEYITVSFDAQPETPLEILKIFHMEYCVCAVVLLNIFALAFFRKSNLS